MDVILIYFIGAVLISIAMFINKNTLIDHLLYIPFVVLQIMLNLNAAISLNKDEGGNLVPFLSLEPFNTLSSWLYINDFEGYYFRTDGIGLIFLSVLTLISTITIIHSVIYSVKKGDAIPEMEVYNGSLVLLIATMSGVLISRHIGLMWAFLEATTLCSSMLIYHNRDKSALEAAWKYIFVCSISVSMAFVGILLLGIAAQDTAELDLTVDALIKNAPLMKPSWLMITFLLVLTGYSAKMGVLPLFTVDIDAKDVAPSSIGALFSGGLMNVGFVAIYRFYEIFANTTIHHWMNTILVIVGFGSIFFAAVYIIKVKNYKRMFAYSSVEHAGLALLGLASGGIGYFAMVLHLIMHSLTKASLFYQMSQVYRVFHAKSYDKVGGYFRLNPTGGIIMILGMLCVTAMPPSGLFVSELMIFKSLFYNKDPLYLYVGLATLFLLCFIFYALGANILKLLFTPLSEELHSYEKVSPWESATQFILIGLVLYFGINPPQEITEFIMYSVEKLPQIQPK